MFKNRRFMEEAPKLHGRIHVFFKHRSYSRALSKIIPLQTWLKSHIQAL